MPADSHLAGLLLRSAPTVRALAVGDTKHKSHGSPKPEDFYQINAYHDLVSAPSGFLAYPSSPAFRFKFDVAGTHIRSLGFDIGGANLDDGGRRFVGELPSHLEKAELSIA